MILAVGGEILTRVCIMAHRAKPLPLVPSRSHAMRSHEKPPNKCVYRSRRCPANGRGCGACTGNISTSAATATQRRSRVLVPNLDAARSTFFDVSGCLHTWTLLRRRVASAHCFVSGNNLA